MSVLPMNLRVGDRFAEGQFQWEVVSRPEHFRSGKSVRVRVQRPGVPESERLMSWDAHERVEVRR